MKTKKTDTEQDKIECLLHTIGVLRSHDLLKHGVSRQALRRLVDAGVVQRIVRGLYRLSNSDATEYHTIADAAKAVPNGIVCLLSALRFHNITTQAPFEIWMAIPGKAHLPKKEIPIRIVRFSGEALEAGVENHKVEEVQVKVYSLAKTVADCFKYRNKIGLDVALEALRECRKQGKVSMDDLWYFAKICRVSNIMRPYMEAVV